MSEMTICLVGFAEALAAPEVFFSLKRAGARIVSFCRRGGKRFARLNFVEYVPVAAPEEDLEAAIREVEALTDRLRPQWIAPCDDAALLVLSRLTNPAARRLLPSAAACDFAMDKHTQITLAAESGFSVPRTKTVDCEADLADFDSRPAILKPRAALDVLDGRLEKGRSFVIRSDVPSEARQAIARRKYLLQEYKDGVGEGFFGIARDGEIYASFGHRRLRMMNPSGSGSSACESRTPDSSEADAAKALVRKVGWHGPFMVESLRDNFGRRWFMEFNGRFWGSLALAQRCGLDIPRLALDLGTERSPAPATPIVTDGFARHLGRDLINLLFVFRGPPDGVRSDQWPSRFSAVKTFIAPNHLHSFYNYHPDQPLFFVKDAIYTVANTIFGRKS